MPAGLSSGGVFDVVLPSSGFPRMLIKGMRDFLESVKYEFNQYFVINLA